MIRTCMLSLALFAAPAALADDVLPPFDFSDAYYLANGINPASVIGRPRGANASSVIDNRENGPNYNNVRIREHTAAYDHSGHPIFFSVTGLPNAGSFTNNAAGREARQIADEYKVYEFPRAANAPFAVFPKRQDLIADLRHGYFSNDPLGVWQVNIVRFTPAALNTGAGQRALASLAARNGRDLDGTPVIKTVGEVEDLADDGFVTISIPAADGSQGFRWFFCPVIEHPDQGAIAPDAFLTRVQIAAEAEFDALFESYRTRGQTRDCDYNRDGSNDQGDVGYLITVIAGGDNPGGMDPDFNADGNVDQTDIDDLVTVIAGG